MLSINPLEHGEHSLPLWIQVEGKVLWGLTTGSIVLFLIEMTGNNGERDLFEV